MISTEFGEEYVNEIYLCSIRQKQDDGFYKVEATIELNKK
jgi:hypothetical protein